MMDRQGRGLAETVWTRLDRKAGAITELTIRQLRNRLSTWVVLAVSFLLLICLLALFIGGVRDGWEPIDNDNDSHDWDGDGYPAGQEYKYGSDEMDPFSFPGSGYFVEEGRFEWEEIGLYLAIILGGMQLAFSLTIGLKIARLKEAHTSIFLI